MPEGQDGLIAAYLAATGQAAVTVSRETSGQALIACRRKVSATPRLRPGSTLDAYWVKNLATARTIAARATETLRARQPAPPKNPKRRGPAPILATQAEAKSAIIEAAKEIGARVSSNGAVMNEARTVIRNLDAMFERVKARGELSALNKHFRNERLKGGPNTYKTYAEFEAAQKLFTLYQLINFGSLKPLKDLGF